MRTYTLTRIGANEAFDAMETWKGQALNVVKAHARAAVASGNAVRAEVRDELNQLVAYFPRMLKPAPKPAN